MLASFASSEGGKAFARIEERYGRDPAASFEPLDDVLAHNLRAAFVVTLADDLPEEDPVEQTKRTADEMRKRIG